MSGNITVMAGVIWVVVLMATSAFLSFAEGVYMSLMPKDIEKLRSDKGKGAKVAVKLCGRPAWLKTGMMITKSLTCTACILAAASICFNVFDFGTYTVFKVAVCSVSILFLLAIVETVPKTYAGKNPAAAVAAISIPVNVIITLLKPFFRVFSIPVDFKRRSASNMNIDGLTNVFDLSLGDVEDDKKLLKGIADFSNTVASEIMCPRINVIAVDITTGFDKIISLVIESGFSRIPVYSDTLDSIKGILYAKDILPHARKSADFAWQTLIRPPYFIPETKKISDLLKEFQTKKIHMAVIIDEYGGASGIVTMEDVLEEIVGEITDESDVDETFYRKLDQSTYIFKGQVLLDDFCKALGIREDYFDSTRGESETLAGLLLEVTGEIPQKGNVIEIDRFRFSIETADKRRIKAVKVKIEKNEHDM